MCISYQFVWVTVRTRRLPVSTFDCCGSSSFSQYESREVAAHVPVVVFWADMMSMVENKTPGSSWSRCGHKIIHGKSLSV